MEETITNSSFSAHISVANIPRFGVDLKYESLKNYLDTISGTINQHAQLIDSLERDMSTKVETTQLCNVLVNVSDGINIHENEFIKYTPI
jgi:hypothetical protein